MTGLPLLKRAAAHLSGGLQDELKRHFFRRQIRRGTFATDEREFSMLPDFIGPGDWALDVGANVGHYTLRMSQLVGPSGRVIALEPVPQTFWLLAANVRLAPQANVTLLNVAASDRAARVSMDIPDFAKGLHNYYQAHITEGGNGLAVMTMPLDCLDLPHRVRLAKIDVEGHELAVLRGMRRLLERDRPVLIVETSLDETSRLLAELKYSVSRLAGSSNVVAVPDTR